MDDVPTNGQAQVTQSGQLFLELSALGRAVTSHSRRHVSWCLGGVIRSHLIAAVDTTDNIGEAFLAFITQEAEPRVAALGVVAPWALPSALAAALRLPPPAWAAAVHEEHRIGHVEPALVPWISTTALYVTGKLTGHTQPPYVTWDQVPDLKPPKTHTDVRNSDGWVM